MEMDILKGRTYNKQVRSTADTSVLAGLEMSGSAVHCELAPFRIGGQRKTRPPSKGWLVEGREGSLLRWKSIRALECGRFVCIGGVGVESVSCLIWLGVC